MSTFNVPITRINAILPIEGADAIELAQVFGYQSVVRKGQFKVGDVVVYIPEASIVPEWILDQLGLVGKLAGPNKNRVKAIKLRGCISQGILMPVITDYPNGIPFGIGCLRNSLQEEACVIDGEDVSAFLGITKYEPPIPIHMAGEVCNLFGHTVAFDIENYQRYPNVFTSTDNVHISEKLHGTFCCLAYIPGLNHPELLDGDFFAYSKGLGSQGLVFKNNEANASNVYQRTLIKHQQFLRDICWPEGYGDRSVYVMGEIYGKGIQDDFFYGEKEPQFRVFDIYRGKPGHGNFVSMSELAETCLSSRMEHVPYLYEGPFSDEVVKQFRDGQTLLGGANIREGVVIRLDPSERRSPEIGRMILKAISPAYLARKGGTEYT